jgi:TRAP-type C4-dicarboxylate transport system substrate-binding protein
MASAKAVLKSIGSFKYILLALLAGGIVWVAGFHYLFSPDRILRVLGQPQAAGPVFSDFEVPFFRSLREKVGGVTVELTPADSLAVSDSHRLEELKQGDWDVVSLRFQESFIVEPVLAMLDVPGSGPAFIEARQATYKNLPYVELELRKNWSAQLLGVWPYGPQILMCRKPIARLSDIRGMRVRVSGEELADLVMALDGIPARIPFAATKRSLNEGLVDCAIASLMSARSDHWTSMVSYAIDLPLKFGVNGYVISEKAWGSMRPQQKERLMKSFNAHVENLWDFAQAQHLSEIQKHRCTKDCVLSRHEVIEIAESHPEDVLWLQNYHRRLLPRHRAGAR